MFVGIVHGAVDHLHAGSELCYGEIIKVFTFKICFIKIKHYYNYYIKI